MTPAHDDRALREPRLDGAQLLIRLDEIERDLKFSPDRNYRRELVREYLRLTDPEPQELDL